MTKNKEIDILLKLIEDKTDYTLDQLKGPRGRRDLTHARRAFCAISRKLLGLTFMEIGSLINRDHTTIIYALKQHESEIGIYADYDQIYKDLYSRLEILYLARTEFSEEYIQARIDLLIVQKNIINNEIDRHEKKIKKMNAEKEKASADKEKLSDKDH